ncbi:MAG: F0F1 ATP synthase subunit A [Anaerolineae bacterium]|nr:F0F1 ATP synthase subunit A [Anaerolineae bacterium]
MRRLLSGRNLAILAILLVITIGGRILFPIPLPTIQLPAEKIPGLSIFGFPITNTLIATLLADVTILVLVYFATRKMEMVPRGLQNVVEWVIEWFMNLAKDLAGEVSARKFLPIMMTIFLLVIVANWWELVPGFDSIGILEHPHSPNMRAYEIDEVGPIGILTPRLVQSDEQASGGEHSSGGEESGKGYVLVPFLRAATTDLNLTLALALVVMFWVQVSGVRALGLGYFKKFFDFRGVIPAIVGILELFSEVGKIISLTFRLFGNIFAGQVLIFVIPFLIPFLVVLPFYGLEVFVGFMQALVFAVLAMVFLGQAVVSHEGGHEEHKAEAGH